MPVDAKHKQYQKYAPEWKEARDAVEGQRAVRKTGEQYLPRLEKQTSAEYDAYKMRALFFNATGRTVQAMLGFLFRKPPIKEPPSNDKEFFETATTFSTDFDVFMKEIADEINSVGRVGIICDIKEGSELPQLSIYRAESIINWSKDFIVLHELKEVGGEDEFVIEEVDQYRVLDLVGGFYRQRLFQRKDGKDVQIGGDVFPLKNGAKMDIIPFVIINQSNTDKNVGKLPLADLIAVNMSHYRSSADLELGRHYVALPVYWLTGYDEGEDEIVVGSNAAWTFPSTDTKVGILEFKGQGLGALEKALNEKEGMMSVLGARLLEAQKKGVEAADTHRIRGAGEQSILSSIANTIDIGVTWISKICAEWRKLDSSSIKIEINKDYAVVTAEPALFTALISALQGGMISENTWFYNLKKWGMIPEGTTLDDELALIAARNPNIGGGDNPQ